MKDGKYRNCKECHLAYVRERHKLDEVKEKHKERHRQLQENSEEYRLKAKQRSRKFYQSAEGRAKTLLNNAYKSPFGKIVTPTVTYEHILEGIKKGFCPVTGIVFDLGPSPDGKSQNHFAPSLDRIQPEKGYTNENTRVVIWQYNRMKGEITDEEVYEMCKQFIVFHERNMK